MGQKLCFCYNRKKFFESTPSLGTKLISAAAEVTKSDMYPYRKGNK